MCVCRHTMITLQHINENISFSLFQGCHSWYGFQYTVYFAQAITNSCEHAHGRSCLTLASSRHIWLSACPSMAWPLCLQPHCRASRSMSTPSAVLRTSLLHQVAQIRLVPLKSSLRCRGTCKRQCSVLEVHNIWAHRYSKQSPVSDIPEGQHTA